MFWPEEICGYEIPLPWPVTPVAAKPYNLPLPVSSALIGPIPWEAMNPWLGPICAWLKIKFWLTWAACLGCFRLAVVELLLF